MSPKGVYIIYFALKRPLISLNGRITGGQFLFQTYKSVFDFFYIRILFYVFLPLRLLFQGE